MTTLRCRKGDMAVVIKGVNLGRIVEVIRFDGKKVGSSGTSYDDVWEIKVSGFTRDSYGMPLMCSDSWLLPIRPGDLREQDETEKELTV